MKNRKRAELILTARSDGTVEIEVEDAMDEILRAAMKPLALKAGRSGV